MERHWRTKNAGGGGWEKKNKKKKKDFACARCAYRLRFETGGPALTALFKKLGLLAEAARMAPCGPVFFFFFVVV